MIDERGRRRVIATMTAAVVIMVAYWALWFGARSVVASDTTKAYNAFENAFPLADAWLTVALLGAIRSLQRRSSRSLFWLLTGGGAGVYLFCMDVLYDVEHGIWWKNGGGAIEFGINVITLVFSVGLLRWAWSNRRSLLTDG
ncbi:MAG TPA: hypothetical protein VHC63_09660 [Acidimicrobiales bacterium]|nr:hypothetical protein [Acidimicrobiales bacterium]